MAQKAGKPVVVSMGSVAASGGYYISLSANRIVAEPGTITGSIGVLTGKVSFGKTLGLVGAHADDVSVGKNTLMDSAIEPFTDAQWANLNHQADVIYDDFTAAKWRRAANCRWTRCAMWQRAGSGPAPTPRPRGLVDALGRLLDGGGPGSPRCPESRPHDMIFRIYPRPTGLLGRLEEMSGGVDASLGVLGGSNRSSICPPLRAILAQASSLPAGGPGETIQLKGRESAAPVTARDRRLQGNCLFRRDLEL